MAEAAAAKMAGRREQAAPHATRFLSLGCAALSWNARNLWPILVTVTVGAITNAVRPSVEVGVPYQAGTEAATAAVNGDGPPPPPPPLGPLDNVWMAHLLPSAKTSAESRVQRSRDRATAKRSNFLVVMESDCSCT